MQTKIGREPEKIETAENTLCDISIRISKIYEKLYSFLYYICVRTLEGFYMFPIIVLLGRALELHF